MYQGMKIVSPPYLKVGDKVALVSPAYWVPEEAITQAAEVIRKWGLTPVIGPHTTSLNMDAYAGTADERAADLKWALEDDSIKAIVCSRGGYGSMHLISRIPMDYVKEHPKWLIGHGDITMLLYLSAAVGMTSIHGPMAFQIASRQEPSTSILRDMLIGKLPKYNIPKNEHNRLGHAEGVLVGGNLSCFSSISGTKYKIPDDEDIILFIEEVEESLHVVDRLFYTLRLQENFNRVKGVIFGSFNHIRYDLQFGSVEQMLTAHLHDLEIPVCCGFPIGSNNCIPLISGAPCTLDVMADGAHLTFNIEGEQQEYNISNPTQLFLD